MLKKILGIFKRDKSNCLYQELVWQDRVVTIVSVILYLIGLAFILGMNMKIFENEEKVEFVDLVFIIIYIVILEIVVLIVNKIFNLKEIKKQLQMREMEILYRYLQTGLIKVSISNNRVEISALNPSDETEELMNEMERMYPTFDYKKDETN